MSEPEQITPALAAAAAADLALQLDSVAASGLSLPQIMIMRRIFADAAAATAAGKPVAIELDHLAAATRQTHADVGRHIAELIDAGWIVHDTAGHWHPTVPAPPAPKATP